MSLSPTKIDVGLHPDSTILIMPLTVGNPTTSRELVQVGLSDFTVQRGQAQLLPPGGTAYSLAGIIRIAPSIVSLQPGEKSDLQVTIQTTGKHDLRAGLLVAVPTQIVQTPTKAGVSLRSQPRLAVPVIVAPSGLTSTPGRVRPHALLATLQRQVILDV